MKLFKKRNISFIIPAYNCAKFLSDAVNSIFNGNFAVGDEVIIVDDASTDNTFKNCKENIQLSVSYNITIIKDQLLQAETPVLIIQKTT